MVSILENVNEIELVSNLLQQCRQDPSQRHPYFLIIDQVRASDLTPVFVDFRHLVSKIKIKVLILKNEHCAKYLVDITVIILPKRNYSITQSNGTDKIVPSSFLS